MAKRRWTWLAMAWLLASAAGAGEVGAPAPADDPVADAVADAAGDDDILAVLDTVVVTGEQPGPGLWKVSRDGRVLWVLGTVSPLPKRMEWNTLDIERRIARAGTVLLMPNVRLEAEGAALGGLFLLPSMMSARNNPDGDKLQAVLPAADYARWLRLKARYLGRDRGVEKRRPILAAMDLREAALDDHDLSQRDVVERAVRRAAGRADVPVVRPQHLVVIKDARAALRDLRASPLDDLDCFRKVLDQVEFDLGTLAARANAWATGDVATLRGLVYADAASACTAAILGAGVAQRQGLADVPAQVHAAWRTAAEAALAEHPESFAVLPMALVTGPRGYLVDLANRGYLVEAPDQHAADATDATDAADAADSAGDADGGP